MVSIFFYNKLTDINYINKITLNYQYKNGYVLVNSFDKENNVLLIDESSNEYILQGKLVKMNISFETLLTKLSNLDEVKYNDRSKYTIKLMNVYLDNNMKEEAWIIY